MSSPNLGLIELGLDQLNPHNTINENYKYLDATINIVVEDTDLTAPPGSPGAGECYIPKATATGDWAGHENKIAYYNNGWTFFPPKIGWRIFDLPNLVTKYWNGTSWLVETSKYVTINEKTTSYVLALADHNKIIVVNSASNLTITLPQTSTVNIPDGFTCRVIRRGSGTVTFAVQGVETLESISSFTKINDQYGEASVLRLTTATWYISGNLGA